MKIRIQGNSLRLRLMQKEVDQFRTAGEVTESTKFGQRKKDMLTYRLVKSSDHKQICAKFKKRCINVHVPVQIGEQWVSSDQVGMEGIQPIGTDQNLLILVEKDFKCSTNRPNEDESDAFPNPNSNC